MTVLINLLEGIIMVADKLLSAYSYVVIAACLITWVNPDPYNPIVRVLRNLTDPLLWRIRKYLPFTYVNGLDLSPVALLIGIYLVQFVVIRSLAQMVYGLYRNIG